MNEAQRWIETLQLAQHPQGGYYRETYRSERKFGERATLTRQFPRHQPLIARLTR
jgi:predicted cupin superfamily sugar epimerase